MKGYLAVLRLGIEDVVPTAFVHTVLIAAISVLGITIVALFYTFIIRNSIAAIFLKAVIASISSNVVTVVALFRELQDQITAAAIVYGKA